jgi:hypothetical protein
MQAAIKCLMQNEGKIDKSKLARLLGVPVVRWKAQSINVQQ